MSKERLNTKFGIAKYDKSKGYYKISSSKEGNNSKLLHRLIYEDYHKVTLLSTTDIHHIDGDKLNNDISNLKAMTHGDHRRLHKVSDETRQLLREAHLGENNHFYGKKHSDESKEKMREAKLGKRISGSHKISISKVKNKTGIFRVYKNKTKTVRQGFVWVYSFYDLDNARKVINSVDLCKLKEKIIKRGLEWLILDEEKAKKSFEETKNNMERYQ